ncbi:MAG: alkaline phosphatase family protein [Candidatus Nanohalobium sp.]
MATVIFGLDGADPELIERWLDELPNFKKIKEKGFFGSFKTTEPPITVPAWMCIFSGNRPSDFDSYDFRTVDFEDYRINVSNSTNFRGKNLIDNSEDVISFRVPGTTPKYPIDGYMVSGFIEGEQLSFEPESLEDELEDIDLDLQEFEGDRSEKKEISRSNFKKNYRVFESLLEEKNFKTAFSVFRLVDTHMHNVDEQKDMLEVYKLADKYLGKMMDLAEKEEHDLVVLSDHGSMQTERKLYLNNYLRQKGFLEYQDEESSVLRRYEEKIGSLLVNLGFKKEVKKLLSIYSSLTGKDPQQTQGTILPNIKKEETEAFCYISGVSRYGAIWLHDDRFSKGVVENREKKADEIEEQIQQEKFIDEVARPEDFWTNPEMPDILVKADKGIVIGGEPYNVNFHKTSAVVHDGRGLLAGIGPSFEKGISVEKNYRDIAPTIQALQGEVDISTGDVLEEIIADVDYGKELKGLDI